MRTFLGMWLFCAACGSGSSAGAPPIDAPPGAPVDAMPDAPPDAPPDAQDPTVQVEIHSDVLDGPFDVTFYTPANAVITTVSVGRDGVASAAMPQGGTVIVIPDPVTRDLDGVRAVFGVQPGDDIRIVPTDPVFHGTTSGTVTVPTRAGTAFYNLYTRCGNGSAATPALTAFYDLDCQPPLPVIVEAQDASRTAVGAFRATLTSLTADTLTGTYLAPDTFSFQITNDAHATNLAASVSPIVAGATLQAGPERSQAVTAGQIVALDLTVDPAAVVDARQVGVTFSADSQHHQAYQRVRPASETAFAFDAPTDGLPWYGDCRYDPAQRKLTLPLAADASIDGQTAFFNFERDPFLDTHWTFVIPPGTTELTVPVLSRPDFDPSTDPDTTTSFTATAIRASAYNGYADLRRGVAVTAPVGSFFDTTVF